MVTYFDKVYGVSLDLPRAIRDSYPRGQGPKELVQDQPLSLGLELFGKVIL
jgi:hypothetical protein